MEKDEFNRKEDEKNDSDSIGDFDEAFLEYGSDSSEDNKIIEENKQEEDFSNQLENNINNQENLRLQGIVADLDALQPSVAALLSAALTDKIP